MNNLYTDGGGPRPTIYNMSREIILQKINSHLPVNKQKKDERGEVFTPPYIIEEMLDTLPSSVWKNPELTWLDPANGIGGFPMIIYVRLMDRLPDTYRSAKYSYSTKYGKSQHILRYMLYCVEIDRENVNVFRSLFGKDANIYHTDFLDEGFPEIKTKTFDIIVGNPPYNQDGTIRGGRILWKDFVFKSLTLLSPSGYLLFIHPTGWRKPVSDRPSSGDIWNLFRNNYHLAFLKMSDEPIPHFPRVDYYLLQNVNRQNKTHVVSLFEGAKFDGLLQLTHLPFIPHFVNPSILSMLNGLLSRKGRKFNIQRDRTFEPSSSTTTTKRSGIPYAFYYDPKIKDYVYVKNDAPKNDIPEYVYQRKIIMTHTRGKIAGQLYPVYYPQTRVVGASSNTMYQLIERGDDVKKIIDFLNSESIMYLMRITQYSETPNHKNEYKILNMLSIPE